MKTSRLFGNRVLQSFFQLLTPIALMLNAVITTPGKAEPLPEPLQTEVTQQDLAIVDRLVQIAQRNSDDVKVAKAALGVSAFQNTLSVELEPSRTITRSNEPDEASRSSDRSFSVVVTLNPISVVSAVQQRPALRARLDEAKRQKRVEVMKHYFAYLQARQATQIAVHQMQAFTDRHDIATRSEHSPDATASLRNPEYRTAAKEMLQQISFKPTTSMVR
jgi:hypothetical protein